MPETTKVLSLWQPWASLVAIGAKRIETRSWSTPHRGPLAIHACVMNNRAIKAARMSSPYVEALEAGGYSRADELPRGVILCVVTLRDVLPIGKHGLGDREQFMLPLQPERAFGDYTAGRFAWLLSNVRRLETPVPFGGGQGLTKSIDAALLKLPPAQFITETPATAGASR